VNWKKLTSVNIIGTPFKVNEDINGLKSVAKEGYKGE